MSCGLMPYSVSKSNVFCAVAASFDPCVVPLLREYWYWKPPVKPRLEPPRHADLQRVVAGAVPQPPIG